MLTFEVKEVTNSLVPVLFFFNAYRWILGIMIISSLSVCIQAFSQNIEKEICINRPSSRQR